MNDGKLYGFDRRGMTRVVAVVRDVEGDGAVATQNLANPVNGQQVIEAQLTARDGTDGTKYAWTQGRRKADGTWETPGVALSGTTSSRPALDPSKGGNLTNAYVTLARGAYKDTADSDKIKPCWYVCGAPLPFPRPLWSCLTIQNSAGDPVWGYWTFHDPVP